MSCCTNTLDLGCLNYCDDIIIGTATQTGNHSIEVTSGYGVVIRVNDTITSGSNITLSNYFEYMDFNTAYFIQVTNPDGTTFTRTVDMVVYDCFEVQLDYTYETYV